MSTPNGALLANRVYRPRSWLLRLLNNRLVRSFSILVRILVYSNVHDVRALSDFQRIKTVVSTQETNSFLFWWILIKIVLSNMIFICNNHLISNNLYVSFFNNHVNASRYYDSCTKIFCCLILSIAIDYIYWFAQFFIYLKV